MRRERRRVSQRGSPCTMGRFDPSAHQLFISWHPIFPTNNSNQRSQGMNPTIRMPTTTRTRVGGSGLQSRSKWATALPRFVNDRPLGFNAKDDDLYRYVGNDPTNKTDPTGLGYQPFCHHYLPVGVLNDLGDYLSQRAKALALGTATGRLEELHNYGSVYNGVKH